MQRKTYTKEEAIQKLKHFCSYQERSHYEVEQKLWELGVKKSDHGEVVSFLIENDYLNEERFAILFAGGKFRMKQWGRKKIIHALKEKKVSDYNIKKALKQIEEPAYRITLEKLAEQKYHLLKSDQHLVRRKKTMDYLVQKGYEHALINDVIDDIVAANKK